MTANHFDLLIIGGGVNGCGIARDAAGRGQRVLLCEKGDLGEGTSSRSSKLIHGGLRYLEYREFRLVREALQEREVLLRIAPHIVRPMRFVIPHSRDQRPAWLVRLGLFIYDHLGGRSTLPRTRTLNLRRAPEGAPLQPQYRRGFEYSDCWTDDSRLVVLNALDAAAHGADVRVRTEVVHARREGDLWHATLRDEAGEQQVTARILVNAAGPWVDRVLAGVVGGNTPAQLRLVKGSHLVVRRFYEGEQAYLLQNDDKRVIFVIPYQDDFCLIGTTDTPFEGRAEDVAVDPAERSYLLHAVGRYMTANLTEADIVAEYAGIRPLHDTGGGADAAAVTRDYSFDVSAANGQAPLLSVFGGKITTYRRLAEHALEKLRPWLPDAGPAWTAGAALPGGNMPDGDFNRFAADFSKRHAWLPADLAAHYARLYGTRAETLLAEADGLAGLGRHFGGLLFEREASFIKRTEWARRADDVLERRTKHGLRLAPRERVAFEDWWAAHCDVKPGPPPDPLSIRPAIVSAPAGGLRAIGFGHSHLVALTYAYPQWAQSGHHIPFSFIQLLDPAFRAGGDRADFVVAELLEQELARLSYDSRTTRLFTCFSGNEHHTYSMINGQRPFDFVLPDAEQLPVRKGAERLPYAVVERLISSAIALPMRQLARIAEALAAPIVAIASPPPVPDNEFLNQGMNAFAGVIAAEGISDAITRYKFWRLQATLTAEACAQIGVGFLHPPPETLDESGYIRREGWHPDGVHALPWYGTAVLAQVEDYFLQQCEMQINDASLQDAS